jgi:hypothetical protein
MGIDGLLKASFINEVMRPRQLAKAVLFFYDKATGGKKQGVYIAGRFLAHQADKSEPLAGGQILKKS